MTLKEKFARNLRISVQMLTIVVKVQIVAQLPILGPTRTMIPALVTMILARKYNAGMSLMLGFHTAIPELMNLSSLIIWMLLSQNVTNSEQLSVKAF